MKLKGAGNIRQLQPIDLLPVNMMPIQMDRSLFEKLIIESLQDLSSLRLNIISERPDTLSKNKLVMLIIRFDGGQANGSLQLTLPYSLGRYIARSLLMLEDQMTLTLEDFGDALGEFINIIAGNLKAHVFQSNELSRAQLKPVENYVIDVPNSSLICRSFFETADHEILEAALLLNQPGESL